MTAWLFIIGSHRKYTEISLIKCPHYFFPNWTIKLHSYTPFRSWVIELILDKSKSIAYYDCLPHNSLPYSDRMGNVPISLFIENSLPDCITDFMGFICPPYIRGLNLTQGQGFHHSPLYI